MKKKVCHPIIRFFTQNWLGFQTNANACICNYQSSVFNKCISLEDITASKNSKILVNLCNKHTIDFACSLSSAQVTGWSLWLLWGSFTNLPQDHLIIHTAKFLTNVLLWGPFDCSPTVSSAQSQVGDTIWRRGDNWAKWMTGHLVMNFHPTSSLNHSF